VAKLYFRYGTMGSAKTMNLLAVAHNYEQQGKRVLLLKPKLDVRFGASKIRSRAGFERDSDILLEANTKLDYAQFEGLDCILVDESQFLSASVIEQLRNLTIDLNIPVICYGLRTNFKTRLFEGSQRLMELADSIEEVKTTCAFCNRKGVFNIKLVNGQGVSEGQEVELGTEELYLPACCRCFEQRMQRGNPLRAHEEDLG
jgi:thymidine kinase